MSGRNTTQIAYGMNELNLPTPGLYAKRKNLLMGSNPIIAPDSEMLWNAAIVWRILRRYEYTGALVMGRRKKIDVNTTSVRTLPEDKWIIAENAHAAIVTRDEYYQAQKAIRNVTPIQYKVGDDFALKGRFAAETVIGSFATKGNMGKWFSIAAINGQPESSLNATAAITENIR